MDQKILDIQGVQDWNKGKYYNKPQGALFSQCEELSIVVVLNRKYQYQCI